MASLTRAECEIIAKNLNPSCELTGYEIAPFCSDTRGYLGTHSRLTLKLGDEEKSCFVKTVEGGNLSACFADTQVFEKEVFVYEMLKKMDAKVDVTAELLYANERTQTFVLENLCEQGFAGWDELVVDEAHMLAAIEALAKFHSVSIAYEEKKSKELGRRYTLVEDYKSMLEPMFCMDVEKSSHKYIKSAAMGIETLVELVVEDARVKTIKEKFRGALEFYWKAFNDTTFRKVLSHGDLKGFNVLYKYNTQGKPIAVKLVDFQWCAYTPPAHDLTMLIYVTSNAYNFQKNVHKYYNHYYNCLSSELKNVNINIESVISKKEFDVTCRLYMKAAKYTWLVYMQSDQSKDETFAKIAQDLNTLLSVVLGEGKRWYVKQNFMEDEVYKMVLTRILWDNIYHITSEGVEPEDCFELIQRKLGSVDYDYLGHTVVKNAEGKYDLSVKIRRDGKEEELLFVLDNLKIDVV